MRYRLAVPILLGLCLFITQPMRAEETVDCAQKADVYEGDWPYVSQWTPDSPKVVAKGESADFSAVVSDIDHYDDPQDCRDTSQTYAWWFGTDASAFNDSNSISGASTYSLPTNLNVGEYHVRCIVSDEDQVPDPTPENPKKTKNWSEPHDWTVYVVGLRIKDGSTDVTDQNRPWIIGKSVALTADGVPAGLSGTYSWTIAGVKPGDNADKAISDFKHDSTSVTLTKLGSADLQKKDVSFYWVDSPGGDVQCTFTAGTKTLTAKTSFGVVKPTTSVTAYPGRWGLDNPSAPTQLMTFGQAPTPGVGYATRGMSFQPSFTDPPGWTGGKISWVQQVTDSQRDLVWLDKTHERLVNHNKCDTTDPYPFALAGDLLPGSTTDKFSAYATCDSPGMGVSDLSVSINDNFKMYLLYTAKDSGIDIPVQVVTWQWTGNAFKMVSWSPTSPTSLSAGAASAVTSLGQWPNWSGNVTDVQLMTIALPDAKVGSFYMGSLTTNQGPGGATLSINGTLPPGLSLSTDAIVGFPSSAGTFSFTVSATAGAKTDSKTLTITVAP